jgi:hypothetical protein
MSNASPRRRRRRAVRLADDRLSISVGAKLRVRLEKIADQHGVSVALVARYAMESGLRGARRRLDKEMASTATGIQETLEIERVGEAHDRA